MTRNPFLLSIKNISLITFSLFIFTISLLFSFNFFNFFNFFLWASFIFYIYIIFYDYLSTDFLFFIRNMMLICPGMIIAIIKIIDVNGYFSMHMLQTQTIEIASIAVTLTNFGVISSKIGFSMAKLSKSKVQRKVEDEYSRFAPVLLLLFLIIFSLVVLSNSAGIILDVSYGAKVENSINLGTAYVFSNVAFFGLLFYQWKYNLSKYFPMKLVLIFSGLYLVIFVYFLHGIRMNAVNLILGIFIFNMIYIKNKRKISFMVAFILLFFYFLVQFIGAIRSGVENGVSNFFLLSAFFQLAHSFDGHKVMILNGTISDISATFTGIIYMIQYKIVDYQYGLTYISWIPRTLPTYFTGIVDEAFIFKNHGMTSGGGFFELGEAYYNFGFIGSLLMPGFFSFIIARIYYNLIENLNSSFMFYVFFGFLSSFMRGGLYQNFAWYKSIVVGILVYIVIMFFVRAKYVNTIWQRKN